MKQKICIFALCGLIVLVAIFVFIKFVPSQECIHLRMWDIFNDESVSVIDKKDIQVGHEKTIDDVMWPELLNFEYNGQEYIYTGWNVSAEMVDETDVICEVEIKAEQDKTEDNISKERKIATVYSLKNVSKKYMLVSKINDVYYQYINDNCQSETLEQYIEFIGSKDNIEIPYVVVELEDENEMKKQYVYAEEIEEWVWNLLMQATSSIESTNVEYCCAHEKDGKREGTVHIYMCNKYSGMEYLVDITTDSTIEICEYAQYSGHSFAYSIPTDVLESELELLARQYKAYEGTMPSRCYGADCSFNIDNISGTDEKFLNMIEVKYISQNGICDAGQVPNTDDSSKIYMLTKEEKNIFKEAFKDVLYMTAYLGDSFEYDSILEVDEYVFMVNTEKELIYFMDTKTKPDDVFFVRLTDEQREFFELLEVHVAQ